MTQYNVLPEKYRFDVGPYLPWGYKCNMCTNTHYELKTLTQGTSIIASIQEWIDWVKKEIENES